VKLRMSLLGVVAAVTLLAGCSAPEPVPTVTVTETTTVTAIPKTAQPATPAAPAASTLVTRIRSAYPGYPLVVDVASIDSRVANAYKTSPQVVALAPGLYTAYNASVTDLDFYIDEGPVSGDCILKESLFPGGACWDGVTAGIAEPAAG
jgi:ABC-type glycerol-3-phosphate transport system substrate-binding protein